MTLLRFTICLTLTLLCLLQVSCSLASLDGTLARIASITVAPDTAEIPSGTIQRFSAVATYNDGSTRDVTEEVEWGTASQTRGLITMVSGVKGGVRALQVGSEAVTAVSANGVTGVAALTVTPATIIRVVVSSDYRPAFRALSKSFVATGVFTDGSTQDVTEDATWAISDSNIMVGSGVSNNEYSASIISPGVATVSATYQGLTGSSEIVVANASLASIEIDTPTSFTSLPAGYFVPLTVTGNYSDGTVLDLTSAVSWSSADEAIATVSNDAGYYGKVTGVAPGTVSITATIDGVSQSANITVTSAVLSSLTLSESSVTTYKPLKTELTVTGTFSDASVLDVTKSVTWRSSNISVATVSMDVATMGEVSALSQGTTTITASKDELSDTASFLVLHYELQSITITLGSGSLPEGFPQTATATATFSDGSTVDVTQQVTWTSSNGSAVIPSPTETGTLVGGVVDPKYSSTGEVTASLGNVTSSPASVTVVEATLDTITVSPASPYVSIEGTSSLTATGNFSNGLTLPLTRFVKWTSSAIAYATVLNSPAELKGTVSGIAIGESTISAKWDASTPNISGSVLLTVNGAPGSVDVSFSEDGQAQAYSSLVYSPSQAGDGQIGYRTTAIQSDDKIILAGSYWDGAKYRMQITRWDPDGTPDFDFDGDAGDANGFLRLEIGAGASEAYSPAVQSDGKILVAGYSIEADVSVATVLRLTTSGEMDTSFGGGDGMVSFGIDGRAWAGAYSLHVLSDGKILVGGQGESRGFLARLNSDGSLDSTFGTSGVSLLSVDSGPIHEILLRSNGRALGLSFHYLAQFKTDGSIDTSFDGDSGYDGVLPLVHHMPGGGSIGFDFLVAESIVLESGGGVVIGGYGYTPCGNAAHLAPTIVRYDANGLIDFNYLSAATGIPGHIQRPTGHVAFGAGVCSGNALEGGEYKGSFTSLYLQSDGKIVAALAPMMTSNGNGYSGSGGTTKFTRFSASGLDSSFGTDGVLPVALALPVDRLYDILPQSDGRLISTAIINASPTWVGWTGTPGQSSFSILRLWR